MDSFLLNREVQNVWAIFELKACQIFQWYVQSIESCDIIVSDGKDQPFEVAEVIRRNIGSNECAWMFYHVNRVGCHWVTSEGRVNAIWLDCDDRLVICYKEWSPVYVMGWWTIWSVRQAFRQGGPRLNVATKLALPSDRASLESVPWVRIWRAFRRWAVRVLLCNS